MKDLFGQDVTEEQFYKPKKVLNSPYLQWKQRNNYRHCLYAEKSCKTCGYMFRNCFNYFKCELLGASASTATDIRASSVCNLWIKKGEAKNAK